MKDRIVDIIVNGEPAKTRSMTTRSFLTSIGVSLILCTLCILAFSVLRKRLRSVYEPRLFVVAKHLRLNIESSNGFFSWIPSTLRASSAEILQKSGLDAYFFLRYIAFVMSLCAILGIPLLIVLLPIHMTGNREGVVGLDRLSTTNLSESQVIRHIAHLIFCVLFTFSSLMMFRFELIRYFRMRAAHIVSQDDYSPGPSSTILIKDLDASCQTEEGIREFFSGIASMSSSSPVRRVWFNRDYTELHKLVRQRNKVLKKLELQELWLIEQCLGLHNLNDGHLSNGCKDATIVGNLWREYLSCGALQEMNGKRGSEISWLKSEMSKLNSQVYQIQVRANSMPCTNSCFVQFDSKLSAFIAARSLGSADSAGIGKEIFDRIHPTDIIWSNLNTISWPSWFLSMAATVLNYVFVFGWAIPVTFISMMAQVNTLADVMPTVHWIFQAPQMSMLMSNVLSPLIVSGLTSQVPTLFRCLARLKGYPTNTRVEMDVQKYLFLFMFFQLFLIVTLSTGLPVLLIQLLVDTTGSAITLANSLSKASTFFISYLMASSLTTAGNTLLQSQQLLLLLWYNRQNKTPRQKLKNKCRYSTIYWGSVFPMITNLGAIAIAYALISPAIMISAVIGLAALYVAFKYRILYCYVPRCVADGDYYPRAIFQLFSGFYCQQVSLLGTLLLSRQLCLAMLVAFVIIITMISQHHLNRLYFDLSTRIPLKPQSDLEAQNMQPQAKVTKEKSTGSGTPQSQTSDTTLLDSSSPIGQPGPLYSRTPYDDFVSEVGLHSPQHMATSLIASSPFVSSPIREITRSDRSTTGRSSPNSAHGTPAFMTPNSMSQQSALAGVYSEQLTFSEANSPHSPGSLRSPCSQTSTQALTDAWTGIFDAFATDFSSLTAGQQEFVSSQLFTHPDMRMPRPCIWIPRDWKGVAQDQVLEMQNLFSDLRSSCHGANIDSNGDMTIVQLPPDFDPLEVIKI